MIANAHGNQMICRFTLRRVDINVKVSWIQFEMYKAFLCSISLYLSLAASRLKNSRHFDWCCGLVNLRLITSTRIQSTEYAKLLWIIEAKTNCILFHGQRDRVRWRERWRRGYQESYKLLVTVVEVLIQINCHHRFHSIRPMRISIYVRWSLSFGASNAIWHYY